MISGSLTTENIPRMLSEFKPQLIVMMGWTFENIPEKQNWIKQYVKPIGIPLIYWATEDPEYTECFTLPLIKNMEPDFIFTICKAKVNDYINLGFRAAHMDFGYHESVHCRVESDDSYKCTVAVVANGYAQLLKKKPDHFRLKSIQTLITPLLKANIPVHFWGFEWELMSPIVGCDIQKDWIHGTLFYLEAHKVYSSADIIIGIQNRPYQITQRTYEILGSEGFLLTSDTPAVRSLFRAGQDLIVSSTSEETVELVHYYLNNPDEREQIRKQGRKAVTIYSYRHRAEYIIRVLTECGLLDSSME